MNYLRSSGYDARPLEGSRQAGFRTVKSLDFVREGFMEIDGTHIAEFLLLEITLFVQERSK